MFTVHTVRNGRLCSKADCYSNVNAQVWKRRLERARIHFGMAAPLFRLRVDGTWLVASYGHGIRPYMLDAIVEYACSPQADC